MPKKSAHEDSEQAMKLLKAGADHKENLKSKMPKGNNPKISAAIRKQIGSGN